MASYVITGTTGSTTADGITLAGGDWLYVASAGFVYGVGVHYGINTASGTSIINAGQVYGDAVGIYGAATVGGVHLSNARSGIVSGITSAVQLGGGAAYIVNDGTMESRSNTISLGGDGNIVINNGSISSSYDRGIICTGAGSAIANTGTITAAFFPGIALGNSAYLYELVNNSGTISVAYYNAIQIATVVGGYSRIINTGTIQSLGGGYSVLTGGGIDSLVNSGVLVGGVSLGDGADFYDGRSGIAHGAIYGGAGTDTLYGSTTATDTLDGGEGADYMNGGGGDDIYYVDDIGDKVIEKADGGDDVVNASVSYTLAAQFVETLTLIGIGNINATGNTQANTLNGNTGNNILDGGAGADTMAGGLGDDTYVVDNAADVVIENPGEGIDTVQTGLSYALGDNLENLTLTGTAVVGGKGNNLSNVIIGNSAANTLTGLDGSDTLDGGLGADKLVGGLDDDTYYVDNAGDTVTELANQGNDTVYSSVTFALGSQFIETLVLTGTAAINGTGNSQVNTIIGNDVNNVLDGAAGSDTLTGGTGSDIFQFSSALGATNVDTITDFTIGQDLVALDKKIFKAFTTNGAMADAAFWSGTAAHDSDDRIIYNSTTGDLFYDADGTGSVAAVKFATLTTGLALTAGSFTIVG